MSGLTNNIGYHATVEDELMDAVRMLLAHPVTRRQFVLAWSEYAGWTGGYRRANARVSQWLSGEGLYRFPFVAIPTLIRVACTAGFLDAALALEAKVLREVRASSERYGPMRSVRPDPRERRGVA